MRFLTSLPLSLLALSPLVFPAQVPFHSNPSTSSTTIVDALTDDPDFTSLLFLLQRARLIPTLNRLNNGTLFAPTNDAIGRHSFMRSMLDPDLSDIQDNVHQKLRQELFYHMLNYSLPTLGHDDNLHVYKTLLFPRKPLDAPSHEPQQPPPWIPIPGGTLGGEPQRLRVASRDEEIWVGADAFGHDGVQVIKGVVNVTNGMLLGIDAVLESPPDLGMSPFLPIKPRSEVFASYRHFSAGISVVSSPYFDRRHNQDSSRYSRTHPLSAPRLSMGYPPSGGKIIPGE
jgi:solute carrier family 25 (mitochondrial carnitine/acylcarnitine transporter), member 20/29